MSVLPPSSALAKFDKQMRDSREFSTGFIGEKYLMFLHQYELVKMDYERLMDEARELQAQLDEQAQQFERNLNDQKQQSDRKLNNERKKLESALKSLRMMEEFRESEQEARRESAVQQETRNHIRGNKDDRNENNSESLLPDVSMTQAEQELLKAAVNQKKKPRTLRESQQENAPTEKINVSRKIPISKSNRHVEFMIISNPRSLLPHSTPESVENPQHVSTPEHQKSPDLFKTPTPLKKSTSQIHSNSKMNTPLMPSLDVSLDVSDGSVDTMKECSVSLMKDDTFLATFERDVQEVRFSGSTSPQPTTSGITKSKMSCISQRRRSTRLSQYGQRPTETIRNNNRELIHAESTNSSTAHSLPTPSTSKSDEKPHHQSEEPVGPNQAEDTTNNAADRECQICDKTFKDRNNLLCHLASAHDEGRFKCENCNKMFYFKSRLDDHHKKYLKGCALKVDRMPRKTLKLQQAKSTTRGSGVQVARKRCTNESFQCDNCPKTFQKKSHIEMHIAQYMNVRPVKCSYCEKYFTSDYRLSHHQGQKHPKRDQLRFNCTFEGCDESFVRKSDMYRHFSVHADYRPFRCSICFNAYKRKVILTAHHKRKH